MHRENLKKLADYLATGKTAKRFDMSVYCSTENEIDVYLNEYECGTVACAAGHGPAAGIEALPDDTWGTYINRVFDLDYFAGEWHWCFSAEWANVDNTPEGAAARINWMLEHGVPSDHWEQITGTAPLCYKVTPVG